MRLERWITWIVIAALMAGACAPSTDADGSPGPVSDLGNRPSATAPAAATIRPIGDAVDPARAAAAVMNAPTDGTRRDAVLEVFAAVGIGVYTGHGDPILIGAERGPDDFFAYDFEIDAFSAAIRDGDRVLLSDIAAGLQAIAIVDSGNGDPTEIVTAAVAAGTADALADPADPSSYPLLVARELALLTPEPLDLATVRPGDPIVLDPLAAFLVAADLVLPSVEATPSTIASGRLGAGLLAAVAPARALAAGPCDRIGRPEGHGGWHAGRGARHLPDGGASVNASASAYLQALLVNATVERDWEPLSGGGLSWHYRHDPADTDDRGYVTSFRLRVGTRTGPILCGLLRGTSMPQTGPIVGVPVDWQYGDLRAHGTTQCPAVGCATSDANGQAILRHLPNLEPDPEGIGPPVAAQVEIIARPDVVQALAPALAAVVRGAGSQRFFWGGEISYHQPYDVFIELESDLRIIEAAFLIGHAADAHAEGALVADSVRSSADVDGACDTRFCVGPIILQQELTVKTTAATDGPKCKTPHILIAGPRKTIDWQVLDAVVYPPAEMRVRMDAGPDLETIDKITYVPCFGPNTVSTAGTSAWEHYVLRSRATTGLVFEGLKVGAARGPGWDVVATDATWRQGGIVAIWDAPENCGGSCDPASSAIKLVISVVPKPRP